MIRITIYLSEKEEQALVRLSQRQLRTPREQARYLLLLELRRHGLLPGGLWKPRLGEDYTAQEES